MQYLNGTPMIKVPDEDFLRASEERQAPVAASRPSTLSRADELVREL